jgi:hypothetical protein
MRKIQMRRAGIFLLVLVALSAVAAGCGSAQGTALQDVDSQSAGSQSAALQGMDSQSAGSQGTAASEEEGDWVIRYDANGGERLDGGDAAESVEVSTARGTDLFERDGYTQTGWNTAADGSGTHVGLGSRVDWEEGLVLYAEWKPWTDASRFVYEEKEDFAVITGYSGTDDILCIPASLGGKVVRRIAGDAFAGADCRTVILPPGLYEVEKGAFSGCSLEELYLYDDIAKVSDYAFEDCSGFRTLHINAVEEPVYSGNYFDTFTDKYDRLLSLKDQKKIVLFSGSSTRFGYDSAMIDAAFSDYDVVNMGVFAYTPALPQLMLILDCMNADDILIHSPEFDASNRQFCSQTELDYATFAMMESDYDLFAELDLRDYEQVFTAFTKYNDNREDMEKKSYDISASDYDEDGNPVSEPSYNAYGDYCLYRPNADEEGPIYGLPVNYTLNAFPMEQYIEPVNRVYEMFMEKGVHVCFTYAPRNRQAISEESTGEERAALHEYFKENLAVPVISELEDSLVSGVYLYGTDNHLSTEGVTIRTTRIIEELKAQLAAWEEEG